MKRQYQKPLTKYLSKKMILISGPRQAGKTTLSKMLSKSYDYINFDDEDDRERLRQKSWDRKKELIIFDELHKKPKWKSWLKGVYDTEGLKPKILVTGSAKVDSYRKVGDSLAGRYFNYRLHPLDVRELQSLNPKLDPKETVEKILKFSGFPEPYLESNLEFYRLWRKTHLDIILKQDLIDLEAVSSVKQIELLIDLLRERVGSPISYSSLARDLQVSGKTIKRWLELLENMYVIFKVSPFSKNIARAVLKKPKYYFYDVARVKNEGARLENLVASSLLKEIHFRQDCFGQEIGLFYLAQKGGLEVDFLIAGEGAQFKLIEVKTSDNSLTKNFKAFEKYFPKALKVQLVHEIKQEKTFPDGSEIRPLGEWLAEWS